MPPTPMSCTMRCCWLGYLTRRGSERGTAWPPLLPQLLAQRRVTRFECGTSRLWVAAERLPLFRALFPQGPARRRLRTGQRRRAGGADRAGGGGARPPGGLGSGHRAGARRRSSGCRVSAHRGGPRGAAGGRLCHARRLHADAPPRGVVRAAPAGAHPPLHGQAPARGDRAGRGARLPALPVRLAARGAGAAHGGPGCGARRSWGSSRATRPRRAPGRPRCCRPHHRDTSRPGWMSSASPGRYIWARLAHPAQ